MSDTNNKSVRANSIIKKYMIGAMGVGILPFPILDMAALTGIQLKMVHSLARLYDVKFSNELGKSAIVSLVGGGGSVTLSASVSSIAKVVPFIGTISMSLFGGASTYAIGKVFIQHFESGGTFLTFDPEQVREYYHKQLKGGQEEVRNTFTVRKP